MAAATLRSEIQLTNQARNENQQQMTTPYTRTKNMATEGQSSAPSEIIIADQLQIEPVLLGAYVIPSSIRSIWSKHGRCN